MSLYIAAGNAAGGIDWGACLFLVLPVLLVIYVLAPGLRSVLPARAGGILMIIAGLVLLAAVR